MIDISKLTITSCLIWIASGNTQEPYWMRASGPVSGQIYVIKVNDNKDIFIGTQYGVSRSTNGGETWKSINEGLTDLPKMDTAPNGRDLARKAIPAVLTCIVANRENAS